MRDEYMIATLEACFDEHGITLSSDNLESLADDIRESLQHESLSKTETPSTMFKFEHERVVKIEKDSAAFEAKAKDAEINSLNDYVSELKNEIYRLRDELEYRRGI